MRKTVVAAIVLVLMLACPVAGAGEVVVQWVSGKLQPNEYLPFTSREQAIAKYGKAAGEAMWKAIEAQGAKFPTYPAFTVALANTDTERRATAAKLRLEFLDADGNVLGEITTTYQLSFDPGQGEQLQIPCDEPYCDKAVKLRVTVLKASFALPKNRPRFAENELAFKWRGRHWYLEDRWENDKLLVLRTFSRLAYTDKGFDGRVFPADKVATDAKRFYRVARAPISAEHVRNPDEVDWGYFENPIAGIKVRDGQKVKPGFLEVPLSNLNADCELKPGEFVQVHKVILGKKRLDLVVAPVCRTIRRHRSVRAYVRFEVGKQVMKGLDSGTADGVIRPWLEPVSIREVAEVCGPKSGTMVKRWSPKTTAADVERQLGTADAEAETATGRVLVYGRLKLVFEGEALAGFEWRPAQ